MHTNYQSKFQLQKDSQRDPLQKESRYSKDSQEQAKLLVRKTGLLGKVMLVYQASSMTGDNLWEVFDNKAKEQSPITSTHRASSSRDRYGNFNTTKDARKR
jgi:hypothetical protein